MQSINDTYKQKIINELITNTLEVKFPLNSTISPIAEKNIVEESMVLRQSICDENKLKFGGCISSQFELEIMDTDDRAFGTELVGKRISVILTQRFPDGTLLTPSDTRYPSAKLAPGENIRNWSWTIFNGYIDSCEANKDDNHKRKIVAYDILSRFYARDGTNDLYRWWRSKTTTNMELGTIFGWVLKGSNIKDKVWYNEGYNFNQSVTSRFAEVVNQAENLTAGTLPTYNKNWLASGEKITRGEVLRSICETLGVFGVIKSQQHRDEFVFVKLPMLTTQKGGVETYDFYEDFKPEEYKTTPYDSVDVTRDDNSASNGKINVYQKIDGAVNNTYDMTKNIFAYPGESTAGVHPFPDIYTGGSLTDTYLRRSAYTPYTATVDGRLWVEVGDIAEFVVPKTNINGEYVVDDNGNIQKNKIRSYILSRTLTGIKALTDKIEAKGEVV